ncbi:hypothetical protein LOD99_12579 [Oopsacas minuta]|uniref:Uncharacterized protein n=1 Tax=Oopsacas minuta TaxID=111878 RepID=A0AAV7JCH6_9METZ|nr:hypothetical protein LOD99_12579 [Oopsacas minuta]
MRKRFVYLIGTLMLVSFVMKLTARWDSENRNVNLLFELQQMKNSYINATLELDKVRGKLSVNTTHPLIQTKSNTIVIPDINKNNNNKDPLQNTKFNHKKPGNDHPFVLLSDISIDKFRIIPEKGRKNYKFVFGIPTIARPHKEKYLLETLDSLLKDPASFQELNILIIIFVADMETDRCTSVSNMVTEKHRELIDGGFIEILCPHPNLYPSLDNVRQTLGDPEDRFKWRSKQNLDFAFLMWYASGKGEYYLQLEDDIIASEGYTYHLNSYVDKVKNDFWFLIHFTQLGFIGKLLKGNDLLSFAQYLLLFYMNQPCDWLLYDYGRGLVCYSGLDEKECRSLLDSVYLMHTPALFQHVGTVSSLGGKIQNLKDPTFQEHLALPKNPIYSNPPAVVTSTFSIYLHNTANILYEGVGMLWSDKVLEGNHIIVEFLHPQELKGIQIRSGNLDNQEDTFENGVVEFKRAMNEEYEYWCDFTDGEAFIYSSESKLIHAIRVIAIESQKHWLLISHFECLN